GPVLRPDAGRADVGPAHDRVPEAARPARHRPGRALPGRGAEIEAPGRRNPRRSIEAPGRRNPRRSIEQRRAGYASRRPAIQISANAPNVAAANAPSTAGTR